jgi:hypothetical protein
MRREAVSAAAGQIAGGDRDGVAVLGETGNRTAQTDDPSQCATTAFAGRFTSKLDSSRARLGKPDPSVVAVDGGLAACRPSAVGDALKSGIFMHAKPRKSELEDHASEATTEAASAASGLP